ncbi:MAG: hypothetical protein KKF89_06220 [Nanoarchaeota archaeon]|nr:hypothetical protein [Nanoarchaeota archaeon]MBU1855295.1 hypothetical protein [Nanoarchaeota archaeon]
MKIIKIILILLIMLPFVYAKSGRMSLLTVGGPDEDGGIADLYLETKPGTGTIYIDSFPLTKLDTQISTRFANEIACDFLDKDCSKYDFFYTIRAKATIVGGPSAGAAVTILTISVLSDLKLSEDTIMTGTINSGGLIGPVAGIEQKINAAVNNNFTKILLPKWQSGFNISKIQEGLTEKIIVVRVKNLEEALYHFTGKDFSKNKEDITVSKDYSEKMSEVANTLCSRSEEIHRQINKSNSSLYLSAENFVNKSGDADLKRNFYSKASYCFSASLRLREIQLSNKNADELRILYERVESDLILVENDTNNQKMKTLSDLEIYMIVKERLSEAKEYFNEIDGKNISYQTLAYATERLYSAVAWSEFFDLGGKEIELNENYLKEACLKKVAEAEERTNYAELYLPGFLESTKKDITSALNNYGKNEFALCIFKASKAKAEANIVLTALMINEDDIENVLLEKLEAIKKIINEQELNNIFPILGYSYFEYANSLMDYDLISSLTFTEYALELSKLDMYFPENKKFNFHFNFVGIQIFLFGFITGVCFVVLINLQKKKHKKTKLKF